MKKIKVMPIFGTRPDAIKMCPLVGALKKCDAIDTVVCVTGQHREMLREVLDFFSIKPQYDLDIMRREQTIETITTDILTSLGGVLDKEKPDLVLVHGDTSTAFASALSAFYHKITVGHVEAGLRSYNIYSPYPEEMNRKLIASLSTLHFAPTELCRLQLKNEGIEKGVYVTGNTEIDAVKKYTVREQFDFGKLRESIDFSKRILFVTAHRRENIGEPLRNICRALLRIANEYEDVQIVYPVHPNPAVRSIVFEELGGHERILLGEPLSPVEAHNMIARSYLLLTDSGGIQEDAAALQKPVVVLRRETERPEGIDAGVAVLGGTDENAIFAIAKKLLEDAQAYEKMAFAPNPYGDASASEKIVDSILDYFGRIGQE